MCLQIGKIRSDYEESMVLLNDSPNSILLSGLFYQIIIAEMRSLTKFYLPNLFKKVVLMLYLAQEIQKGK